MLCRKSRRGELVRTADLAHEPIDAIELAGLGEAKIHARDAVQRLRVVLHDRSVQKVAQRTGARRAVAGPAGAILPYEARLD